MASSAAVQENGHTRGEVHFGKENSNLPSPHKSPVAPSSRLPRPSPGKLKTPLSFGKPKVTSSITDVSKQDTVKPKSAASPSPRPFPSPKTPVTSASPRTPASNRSSVVSKEPLSLELTRLENELKSKDLELAKAAAEAKALKLTERQKEKAVAELSAEIKKLKEKCQILESQLESKALELKRTKEEKSKAVADAQAAEGTLRRLHASQKDSNMPSLEAALAPLEAELKMKNREVAKYQEDAKASERLTRVKEAALLEAEKKLEAAAAALASLDDLKNVNQELLKQIDSLQEEKKVQEKVNRQKVADIERLSAQVEQLQETISRSGEAANMLLESQQEVQKLQKEKRSMELELARAKVTANRVAVAAAAEWKDDSDKVIPVRQWMEERRFLQEKLNALQEKLEIAQRQAKSEVHKKDRLQQRMKVIEDSLKQSAAGKAVLRRLSGSSKDLLSMSISQSPRLSENGDKAFFASEVRSEEDGTVSVDGDKEGSEAGDDVVSGLLYDLLQKEVMVLRKAKAEQDQVLQEKSGESETLTKKCGTLERALKTEAEKAKREIGLLQKEMAAMRSQLSSKEDQAKEREETLKKETFRLKAKLHAIQQTAV